MPHDQVKTELRQLVDSLGLDGVLAALADVCSDKAWGWSTDNTTLNLPIDTAQEWGNRSKTWTERANQLEHIASEVRRSGFPRSQWP